MRKIAAYITLAMMLLAMLSGCKSNIATPSLSPNVPIVSESPAIASPDLTAAPAESPMASAEASTPASPEASK
ncbi:MAG: hypothetical protein KBI01_06835 [Oscillospiraceae bacterium]|nr:hypothetical protein [Oscillospiraceae bacterium]